MKFKNYFKVLFIGVSLVFLNGFKTYSQQIYATTATEISEGERVDNVDNAAIIDSLFATVNSAGTYSGELKLEFPSTVPANSTAYIKVDDLGKGDLDFLLGGSLGDLLADAGGTATIGDHYVQVSALDSIGEVVAEGDTDNLFNDSLLYSRVPLRVVKNKDGDLFITITPTVAYKAIVIKDITDTEQLLSFSNFTNVYYAFYLDPTDTSCNSEEIFTSFDGTGITLDLLGLGVTGVKDLEFAIDNDSTSFSKISVGIISAEASMYQDIYFSTTATTEDILDLSIRPKSGFLVNAAVLQNITIELYKEEEVVFSQDLDAAIILEADPNQDGEITNITTTPGVEFDRLRVTLTSPLGVNLDQQVDLFNVKVTPPPPTAPNPQYFCAVNNPTIADLEAASTGTLIWYDKATGGTAYETTDALDLDTENNKKYYASNLVGTCESTGRAEVTVIIKDPSPADIIYTTQTFCAINNPTVEDLEATAEGTLIWYNAETEGTAYEATTALVNGLKYFAVNYVIDPDKPCESRRLEVIVVINNPTIKVTRTTQTFCAINNPTIADLEATLTPPGTIRWYNQQSDGTLYNNTDALVDGLKYYAANYVEYPDGYPDKSCESKRAEVAVTITDPEKPVGDAEQNFCIVNEPKIADLKATASGTIIWYDQATGGTAYNDTDALVNTSKYYAANSDGTCESSERLEVTVFINDIAPATVTTITQFFCAVENPTIADLKATASGTIMWYDQLSRGNVYKDTDALVNNLKYYVANSDGTCESSERLEVSVVILDTNPPSGANSQTFCSTQGATIADLEATASGTITWYNEPTEGTAYANTDALANDFIYYAANSDGSCESSERFKVTVLLTAPQEITIEGENANICFANIETYSVPKGYAPYTWDMSGGELVSGGKADDNQIIIKWTSITDTKVSVTLTGGCYSSNSAEQIVEVIVCSDLTIKNEVDFNKPKLEDIVTFTVDVKNSDKTIFTDVIISEVLPSGFTFKSYTTSLGIYNPSNEIWNIPSLGANGSATLTLTVKVNTTGGHLNTASIIQSTPIDKDLSNNTAEALVTPSCLEFYNIITPNGDGLNDNFVISCIDTYIGAVVEIYDRYGSIVYKKQNYKNDWNGVSNQSGKGQKLPNGTYFFVLKFNNGNTENIKSYIQIIR